MLQIHLKLIEREIVVIDVLDAEIAARFPSKREFVKIVPFSHCGFPENSLLALITLQTKIMLIDSLGEKKDTRRLLLDTANMGVSHFQNLKVHPVSPNFLFLQSPDGILVNNLDSNWIAPAFDLMPGKMVGGTRSPARCLFATGNSVVSVNVGHTSSGTGLANSQRMILELHSTDHVTLSVSPSLKYMLLFWRGSHSYQLVRIRDKVSLSDLSFC